MTSKTNRFFYLTLLADLALLVIAFAIIHYSKYGHVIFSATNQSLFILILSVWAVVKGFNGKSGLLTEPRTFLAGLTILGRSALIMVTLLSFVIVAFHLMTVSRIQAYGTCLLYFLLNGAGYSIYYLAAGKARALAPPAVAPKRPAAVGAISRTMASADALLVFIAFVVSTWLKRGFFELTDDHLDILMVLYGLWLLSSLATGKFQRGNFTSDYSAVAPYFKAALLMILGLAAIIFGLRLFYFSRMQIFGTILFLFAFEVAVVYIYSRYRSYGGHLRDIDSAESVRQWIRMEQKALSGDEEPVKEPVAEKLRNALDFFNPALFHFIRDAIDLNRIDRDHAVFFYAESEGKIEVAENKHYRLVVNLQRINDIRWINQYLLVMHTFLKENGYLVGMAQTTDARMALFRRRLPKWPARMLYLADFLIHRILPKLPVTKKIYFALTKGRNRAISRAEILGRLYFCGFRAVAEMEIKDRYYFIAQKVKTPSQNPNPTYGPLVLLSRTGAFDQPITVYKFRTMHPYAEYLQDYIYEKHLLDKGGKFKDDFRVTEWGWFMRRFWLDELPMFYNWFKGDLQLVGVRPLSKQYLSLYTDELRALRMKVKPGLLPPFYADLPKTLDEIMASEKRYIQAYLQKPIRTQWRYFFKCVNNILFLRARSA